MFHIRVVLDLLRRHGFRVCIHRVAHKLLGKRGEADMLLAHRYCRGKGIELGASASNPFHLENCRNVAPYSQDPASHTHRDFEFFKQHQMDTVGECVPVDVPGSATEIPLPDHDLDYVLSSHVVEHLPDLVGAFLEWNRVLKPSGIIFMIFPKRDATEADAARSVTPLREFIADHERRLTLDTHPLVAGIRRGGHYHVLTLASMLELINWCNQALELSWRVLRTEETDSKVGNGHTVVCQYYPAQGGSGGGEGRS